MNDSIKIRKLPPTWFIKSINAFRTGLVNVNRRMFPASVVLYEYFQYFWLLPCLRVAAELDIAGKLKDGPKTAEQLALETDTEPEYLFRILRALASQSIFKQRKDGTFSNTPLSKALIDGPGSLRYMIMQHLGTLNWTVFNDLSWSVKHGRDAFMKVYEKPIYDFLSENPIESNLFDRSMTNLTELAIEPILSAYDFSGFATITDIGGGEGLLLSSILYKNPEMQGILFDLPVGLKNAPAILEKYQVASRVTIEKGDFFKEIPSGTDAYLLKHVIHNWSDHDSVKILANIAEVMPGNGKVLLVEMLIEDGNAPSFGKLIDIQMMVFMQSGKERTRKEYESILKQSGLKINRIIPTIAPFSIIEAIRED